MCMCACVHACVVHTHMCAHVCVCKFISQCTYVYYYICIAQYFEPQSRQFKSFLCYYYYVMLFSYANVVPVNILTFIVIY